MVVHRTVGRGGGGKLVVHRTVGRGVRWQSGSELDCRSRGCGCKVVMHWTVGLGRGVRYLLLPFRNMVFRDRHHKGWSLLPCVYAGDVNDHRE